MVTLTSEELAKVLVKPRRYARWGAILGVISGALVAALIGLLVVLPDVTHTVRHDIGAAAVLNCAHSKQSANVLQGFLMSDAQFNAQLGFLDGISAAIDKDLAQQVAKLLSGAADPLTRRIANDYRAQSAVFQQLARLRTRVADLWAGKRLKNGKRSKSLVTRVVKASSADCGRILAG